MSSERKFYLLITVLLLVGYIWTGYALRNQLVAGNNTQVCLFKNVTGIPCPSCGSTRSVVALLKGEIYEAVYLNPFGLILLLGMAFLPFMLLADLFNKKLTLYHLYLRSIQRINNKRMAWVLILLVMLNWIWNIQKQI